MKSSFLALALALSVFAVPTESRADGFWNYGTLFGNVCRNGAYYQVFPQFAPVGYTCYMPAWNVYGVVATY